MAGRNKLGLGSRLSRSADGVLQAFPSFAALSPFDPPLGSNPKLPSTSEDAEMRESAALLGVQVDLGPVVEDSHSDFIRDALLVSGSSNRAKGANKRSISEETDLVAGRHLAKVPASDLQGEFSAFGSPYMEGVEYPAQPREDKPRSAPSNGTSTDDMEQVIVSRQSSGIEATIERREMPVNARASSLSNLLASTSRTGYGARNESADKEKALMAQIKALTLQLEKEKNRKKEHARAANVGPEKKRSRLVICTHMLPYHLERSPEDGQLTVGSRVASKLAAFERLDKFDVLWVGYLSEHVNKEEQEHVRSELAKYGCVPVYFNTLAEREAAEAMSTEVLWPLLHYIPLSMLDCDTDLIYQRYQSYIKLNQSCADVLKTVLKPTDLVWIHDYHLILLPAMVREIMPQVKIGWFLYTPFPSSEIYVTLPLRKEILRGVLAADLIAFHTYDYVRHFMHACSRVLGTDIMVESKYILDSSKRSAVTVDAFPIGIDQGKFERMLSSSMFKDKVIELQRGFDGKRLILGIDRMDYVKGIPHKLIALEKFFHAYPQWAKKVVLVQIATPPKKDTARYQKLRNKVHKLVGRINGRYSTLAHTPIRYLDQPVDFVELCALYFLADIAMITSLREGMSKVAFEFVACQQRNHGVLILSEFSGGAQTLGSGAILVNPFNTDEVSRAIYDALHMPEQEREERHQFMSDYVSKFTIQKWGEDFVNELQTQEPEPHSMLSLEPPLSLPIASVIESYRQGSRRLIILGLLGTLIDYSSFKDMQPMADALWKDMLALASDSRNTVVVVSGRERALVSQWLGDLPVWIVAENSIYYRLGGRSVEWSSQMDGHDDAWLASIKPVFKYFEERTPGSMTETQDHSITWHYREADEDFGEVQASDLLAHLDKVLGNQPVEVSLDSKMVQVRPYAVSKGAVLEPLMEACTGYRRLVTEKMSEPRESNVQQISDDFSPTNSEDQAKLSSGEWRPVDAFSDVAGSGNGGLDFLLCINWATMRDEDIFGNLLSKDSEDVPYSDYLPEQSALWTCRVGAQPSQARYFVEDEGDVHALLATLAAQSQQVPTTEPSSIAGEESSFRLDSLDHLVPSALEHIDEIKERMLNMQLAFFLDYDGTLTPIVDNPSEARLTEEARSVVRALAARHPTAIVSGRARATAHGLVQLDELYYAGSHGYDISGPLRRRGDLSSNSSEPSEVLPSVSFRVAESFRPALEEAKSRAEEALAGINGALVEDNTFSVSVHYRMAAEDQRDKICEVVNSILADMPMLRRTYGKMVYELRPSGTWDKGKAVEWLLDQIKKEYKEQISLPQELAAEQDFFPLYIGDDVTDEDAFRVMGDLNGLGIIVSDTALEGSTAASYALRSPAEVVQFLDHFAQHITPFGSSSDISGLLTPGGLVPSLSRDQSHGPSPKLNVTSGRSFREDLRL